MLYQGRHNFSKTGGAAQKLGGQNIKNDLILTVFGVEFQGKWVKISKNWGDSRPPCHPPSDAPVIILGKSTELIKSFVTPKAFFIFLKSYQSHILEIQPWKKRYIPHNISPM